MATGEGAYVFYHETIISHRPCVTSNIVITTYGLSAFELAMTLLQDL